MISRPFKFSLPSSYQKMITVLLCLSIMVPSYAYADTEAMRVMNRLFNNIMSSGSIQAPVGESLIGVCFRVLNISILIFGATFAGATITQGVIQTAGQGTFMGKRHGQSAYFTMFRTLVGLSLVFPYFHGFSAIQMVVLKSVQYGNEVAGNISKELIDNVPTKMLFPDVFSEEPSDPNPIKPEENKLFYRNIMLGAFCVVNANDSCRPTFSTKDVDELYEVSNDAITFVTPGKHTCGSITLNAEKLKTVPQMKKSIDLLVNQAISVVYQRSFRRNEGTSSYCKHTINYSSVAKRLAQSIKSSHVKYFARKYLPKVVVYSTENTGADKGGEFAKDWFYFPIYFQAASMMPNKKFESAKQLLNNYKTTVEEVGKPLALIDVVGGTSIQQGTPFEPKNEFGAPKMYEEGKGDISWELLNSYINGENFKIEQPELKELNLGNFLSKKNRDKIKDDLSDNLRTSGSESLESMWTSADRGLKNGRSTNSYDTELKAMKDPNEAIVREVYKAWTNFYMPQESNQHVLAPGLALGNMAKEISKSSTLYMFIVIRDVLYSSIQITLNTMYTMLATLALDAIVSGKALFQENAYDMLHCLILPPNPVGPVGLGGGTRVPACLSIGPLPLLWPATIPAYLGAVLGTMFIINGITPVHVGWKIVNVVSKKTIELAYQKATLSRFQYVGYSVAAVTPVMLISNLISMWAPLLPSIVYFIAIIGWIFVVIEGVVSAPLIALGMTFPQGHDFLGSAQQSLILLIGVFVRAPLIVIGFYFGLLLVACAFMMISWGLIPILDQAINDLSGLDADAKVVTLVAFMVVTMYLSATVLSQGLSICYKLPAMVGRWLGGQTDQSIEEAAIQQIQRVVNSQQQSVLGSLKDAGLQVKSSGSQIAGSRQHE